MTEVEVNGVKALNLDVFEAKEALTSSLTSRRTTYLHVLGERLLNNRRHSKVFFLQVLFANY